MTKIMNGMAKVLNFGGLKEICLVTATDTQNLSVLAGMNTQTK